MHAWRAVAAEPACHLGWLGGSCRQRPARSGHRSSVQELGSANSRQQLQWCNGAHLASDVEIIREQLGEHGIELCQHGVQLVCHFSLVGAVACSKQQQQDMMPLFIRANHSHKNGLKPRTCILQRVAKASTNGVVDEDHAVVLVPGGVAALQSLVGSRGEGTHLGKQPKQGAAARPCARPPSMTQTSIGPQRDG